MLTIQREGTCALKTFTYLLSGSFVHLCACAIGLLLAASLVCSAQVTIMEYPVPTSESYLSEGIAAGPDGNLWFIEGNGIKIVKMTTAGVITGEFSIPNTGIYGNGSGTGNITAGPDGNLWFPEYFVNKIGRMTTTGLITGEFSIPSTGPFGNGTFPYGITAGPDGNLWFTESVPNQIGRITPAGVITEFSIPSSGPYYGGTRPWNITAGPDGNVWFTENDGNKIGRITPAGVITEFSVPTGSSVPYGITTGPDGNPWFVEATGKKIAKVISAVVNQPPSASAGGPYNGNEGSAIAMSSASASDPNPADTLTYTWSVNSALCSFSNGTVLNPNLTCSDNGSFTATLTVSDGVNPAVSSDAALTVNNVAPTATLSNNGPVNEGSAATISVGSPADVSSADTAAGFHYAYDCNNGSLAAATYANTAANGASTSCTFNDNGSFPVKARIIDKDGGYTEYTTMVAVNNVAPRVTISGPASGALYAVGTPVTFSGSFTDPGKADTHTAKWLFDAIALTGTVSETPGSGIGTVSNVYSFTTPGVYQITLTVTDDDLGAGNATTVSGLTAQVIVYDPSGGFVTGGGWINSPAGAFRQDLSLTGKATFGFESKYQKGATVPAGQTEFQFHEGSFNFQGSLLQWLVVAGAKAQYKGSGTVNAAGNYGFLLTAVDGQVTGGGGVDTFRIKIWDVATSIIVYDNVYSGSDDFESAPTQAIAGGSIVIHSK